MNGTVTGGQSGIGSRNDATCVEPAGVETAGVEAACVEAVAVSPAELDGAATLPDGTPDRRRPGRLAHVDPQLIPLLRTAEVSGMPPSVGSSAPMFGIAVGVALSVPLWMLIGMGVRALLR